MDTNACILCKDRKIKPKPNPKQTKTTKTIKPTQTDRNIQSSLGARIRQSDNLPWAAARKKVPVSHRHGNTAAAGRDERNMGEGD